MKLKIILNGYKVNIHDDMILKSNLQNTTEQLKEEITTLQNSIDEMYIDKLSGKITEEMYKRINEKLSKEITLRKQQLEFSTLNKNNTIECVSLSKPIPIVVKDFLRLKDPSREMILKIIKRIEIHQDKTVDLYFNFKEPTMAFGDSSKSKGA